MSGSATWMLHRRVPQKITCWWGKPQVESLGCPFSLLLLFGQAKRSNPPAGAGACFITKCWLKFLVEKITSHLFWQEQDNTLLISPLIQKSYTWPWFDILLLSVVKYLRVFAQSYRTVCLCPHVNTTHFNRVRACFHFRIRQCLDSYYCAYGHVIRIELDRITTIKEQTAKSVLESICIYFTGWNSNLNPNHTNRTRFTNMVFTLYGYSFGRNDLFKFDEYGQPGSWTIWIWT